MVECESMKDRGLLGGNDVLIDTWWNVNGIEQNKIERMFEF